MMAGPSAGSISVNFSSVRLSISIGAPGRDFEAAEVSGTLIVFVDPLSAERKGFKVDCGDGEVAARKSQEMVYPK